MHLHDKLLATGVHFSKNPLVSNVLQQLKLFCLRSRKEKEGRKLNRLKGLWQHHRL